MEAATVVTRVFDKAEQVTYVVRSFRTLTPEEMRMYVVNFRRGLKEKPKPGTELDFMVTVDIDQFE